MSVALGFVKVGENVLRYDVFVAALFKQMDIKLMKLHAALGIAGEAGEIVDVIKKLEIYNKPMTPELFLNIVEELGDIRFFVQALQNIYGITEVDVLQCNANKLATRYKDLMYTDAAAIDRADKS